MAKKHRYPTIIAIRDNKDNKYGKDGHRVRLISAPIQKIKFNAAEKITLLRTAEILKQATDIAPGKYHTLEIILCVFDDDNPGRPKEYKKKYIYISENNSLRIDVGNINGCLFPVFANDNGVICTDLDTLFTRFC